MKPKNLARSLQPQSLRTRPQLQLISRWDRRSCRCPCSSHAFNDGENIEGGWRSIGLFSSILIFFSFVITRRFLVWLEIGGNGGRKRDGGFDLVCHFFYLQSGHPLAQSLKKGVSFAFIVAQFSSRDKLILSTFISFQPTKQFNQLPMSLGCNLSGFSKGSPDSLDQNQATAFWSVYDPSSLETWSRHQQSSQKRSYK